MTALVEMQNLLSDFTETVLLHNVSWSTYENFLRDRGEAPSPRLTYDRGDLLIMVTSLEHELINGRVADLIKTIALEFEIEALHVGSTTYKRKELHRGFEPDSCFYFKNEARMRGKKRLNLPSDPPPDLVIEIDVTHPSLNKLRLFAAFGVPEVWRFNGQEVEIYVLRGIDYTRAQNSLALPFLAAETVSAFISGDRELGWLEWVKNVRRWARDVKAAQER